MKKQLLTISALCLAMIGAKQTNAQSTLWGMDYSGGDNYIGSIFKVDPANNMHSTIYSLNVENPGSGIHYNDKLCQATNGKLYGTTTGGGTDDIGVLYELDPATGVYTVVIDFDYSTGYNPYASPIQAVNGKLYGTTSQGGTSGSGVIYEYDLSTNVYTIIHSFQYSTGGYPYSGLFQASNGILYGMAQSGGSSGYGVIFEYDLSNSTYTVVHNFNYSNGGYPYGNRLSEIGTTGILYGMTYYGGNWAGVIFEYNTNNDTYTHKYSFNSEGYYPFGDIIMASDGKMYGMLTYGGSSGYGSFFEYDTTTNSVNVIRSYNYSNGGYPYGSVIEATTGKLYGMTQYGGANYNGHIFEYDLGTSTYSIVHDMEYYNGGYPLATLTKATNGKLYAASGSGGTGGYGVVFEYDVSSDEFNRIISFNDPIEGRYPYGRLTRVGNRLYGMTYEGGDYGMGVIFEYDYASNTYTKKMSFADTNGSYPYGGLTLANNGKLYGLTYTGGSNGLGVLFEYNQSNNTYTVKQEFNYSNGAYPYNTLTRGNNGKLYGTTYYGGDNYYGTIIEYDPINDTLVVVYDFDYSTGAYPYGDVIDASNGKFYGMTYEGGSDDYGVLFEFDTASGGTYTVKVDFDGTNGAEPFMNGLIEVTGKLYGMTSEGGTSDEGVLFEFNIASDTFIVKHHFNYNEGSNPYGSLTRAANGLLYGTAYNGGYFSNGTVFSYNPSNGTYTTVSQFNGLNGMYPYGDVVEICMTVSEAVLADRVLICTTPNATYQWLDCDNGNAPITGATDAFFIPSASGNYAVRATINGCSSVSDCINITLSDISDKTSSFVVYPNPNKGIFVVESQKVGELYIITDLQGKVLREGVTTNLRTDINLSEYERGMYILKMNNQVVKIVKN